MVQLTNGGALNLLLKRDACAWGAGVSIQYRSKLRHTDRSTEQMQKSLQRRCTAVMGNNCVISACHCATKELDHSDIMSADVTIGCVICYTNTLAPQQQSKRHDAPRRHVSHARWCRRVKLIRQNYIRRQRRRE